MDVSTLLVELKLAKFCGGCSNDVTGSGGGVMAGYKVAGEGSDRVVDDA